MQIQPLPPVPLPTKAMLASLVLEEGDLQVRALEVGNSPVDEALQVIEQAHALLVRSVAIAAAAEAVTLLGLKSMADVRARAQDFLTTASRLAGFDVVKVHPRPQPAAVTAPPDVLPSDMLPSVRQRMAAIVAAFPTSAFEALAQIPSCESGVFACEQHLDWLRAYVARHAPDAADPATLAAGRAYAEGRLSLGEVAVLLSLGPSDAVALLEKFGFHRSLDVLRLPQDRRADFARRLAERSNAVEADRVHRDVVASQRIEDVDARRWLPTMNR